MLMRSKTLFWREQLSLWFLLVISFFYFLPHINHFYVPASDFFDIDEKAKLLQSFSWPQDFKRPPLFPFLTALFAWPFSGKYAVLYAAELLTLASTLGALFFLYRISERLVGRTGFWVAWLWILHPSTLLMAVKPKPDMAALFCILWAFYWYLQGKPKAFFPAFLATLLRYEGAIVIAAFFAADLLFSRKKLRSFLLSLLSGSFIVLWTLLHSGSGTGAGYNDYFTGFRLNWDFIRDFALQLLEIVPLPLKLTTAAATLVGLLGLDKIRRRSLQTAVALTTYASGFIAMHLIWPFPSRDYGVLGVWVFLIFITAGSTNLADKTTALRRPVHQKVVTFVRIAAIATLAGGMLLFQRRLDFHPLAVFAFTLAAAVHLGNQKSVLRSATGLTALTAAFLLACFSLSLSQASFRKVEIEKAEYRLVGEWFEKHRKDDEKMAVDQPTIVSYFTQLDKNRDFIRLIDLPSVAPDSLSRWLRQQKVAYVVWFSTQNVSENADAWTQWKMMHRGWQTIEFLQKPNVHPDFVLVDSLSAGKQWALIYRLVDPNHEQN